MKISSAGIAFIAAYEGTVLHLYDDPGGHCTVGIGHLVHLGACDGRASEAPYRGGISQERAEELFREDVWRFERAVNMLGVALTQNQFDALVSFAYNLGAAIFDISPALTTAIRRGDGASVCQELRRYVWAVGSSMPLPGLVRRREAECELFNRAEEDDDMAYTLVLGRDPAEPGMIYVVYKDSTGHPLWKTHLKDFADMPKLGVTFPVVDMVELRSVGTLR